MNTVYDLVYFVPNKLYGEFAEVCWGLIKGVRYLHTLHIAHRNIKPANLLFDCRASCLKIINYDSTWQVEDKDKEVNDLCRAKHWIVPEIENKLMYSPIKGRPVVKWESSSLSV